MKKGTAMNVGRVLLFVFMGGCVAAGRGSYFLVEAQKELSLAREAGAPKTAIYQWTLADEFMHKAWEEWSYSDFGASEASARKCVEWSKKAKDAATAASMDPTLENAGKDLQDLPVVPQTKPETPIIKPADEPLEIDLDDEDEEEAPIPPAGGDDPPEDPW